MIIQVTKFLSCVTAQNCALFVFVLEIVIKLSNNETLLLLIFYFIRTLLKEITEASLNIAFITQYKINSNNK